METLKIALGLAGLIVLMGIAGQMDYEDELLERQAYCDMRMIYENAASQGVPPGDRPGWPNFKDEEYQCDW